MKSKLTLTKIVVVVAALLFTTIGLEHSTFASPGHALLPGQDNPDKDHGICKVESPYWNYNQKADGTAAMSLLYALNIANSNRGDCDKEIIIAIGGSSPKIYGVDQTIRIRTERLKISGGGTMLDVGAIARYSDDNNKCAITIEGSGIIISNLEIRGAAQNQNVSGVCTMTNDNSLSNVTVTSFTRAGIFVDGIRNVLSGVSVTAEGGSSAVEFSGDSTLNRILPSSELIGGKNLIKDTTTNQSGNAIIMTNRVPQYISATNSTEKVDKNGFIDWEVSKVFTLPELTSGSLNVNNTVAIGVNDQVTNLTLGGSSERIIESQQLIVPVIQGIVQQADSSYLVRGKFLKFSDPNQVQLNDSKNSTYGQINCKAGSPTSVTRLAVFAADGVNVKFVGVVGHAPGAAQGIKNNNGTFSFIVSSRDTTDAQNNTIGKIVVVPFDNAYALVGKASNYRELKSDRGGSDCAVGTDDDRVDDPQHTPTSDALVRYLTLGQCVAGVGGIAYGETDFQVDSDNDGIEDGVEMSVFKENGMWVYKPTRANCSCDGRLSCWYEFDSDYDGISDSKDNYPKELLDYIRAGNDEALDLTAVTVSGSTTAINMLKDRDSNNNGKPDVRDSDSDSDGLADGMEDRVPGYHSGAPSYFYKVESGVIAGLFTDKTDKKVPCDLSSVEICEYNSSSASNIGVCYGKFIIKDADGKPVLYNEQIASRIQAEGATPNIQVLACRSSVLGDRTNFDGEYNDKADNSSPSKVDSDDDCVCDGFDNGCSKMDEVASGDCRNKPGHTGPILGMQQFLNDGCPSKPYPTNDCSPSCTNPNLVLSYVKYYDDQSTLWKETGSGIELVDSNNDGIKDLFQKFKRPDGNGIDRPDWETISQICSDIDHDGIPDCVEQTKAGCYQNNVTGGFNPYSKDTDNDNLVDGMKGGTPDKCPTQGCTNPKQVYSGQLNVDPFVSCYLDRDGDGLRDCEEDKDMDGDVDKSKAKPELWLTNKDEGLKEILKGVYFDESDPLNDDTDGDTLKDYMEVKGPGTVHTSPNRDDTDGDGLKDNLENRDNVAGFQVTLMGNAVGCSVSANRDTDPTLPDTDGDGLTDKIEVDGPYWDKDETVKLFQAKLKDPTTWTTGIPTGSNPLSVDSDGDGLKDGEEYQNGLIGIADSNPCILDSDGDGNSRGDFGEKHVCRLRADPICVGVDDVSTISTADSDGDGLSNISEAKLGTDSNNRDTDGDGLLDGQEDTDGDGIINFDKGDSNPKLADTDKDGLNDFIERKIGTRPDKPDTDGDCILDGIEDIDHDGEVDKDGSNFVETDPTKVDTDGDTLWDGRDALMRGEDLDCNGRVNMDANGALTETDPRRADTDGDGADDRAEMYRDGNWSLSNLGDATSGRQGGCTMVAGGEVSYAQMIIVMIAALAMSLARAIVTRMRKSPAC